MPPLSRRQFLAGSVALPASLYLPQLSHASGQSRGAVVFVELDGGNDDWNTIIPLNDPDYRAFRPSLAVGRSQTLHLDSAVGLHPALAPLLGSWAGGELALCHGIAARPSAARCGPAESTGSCSNPPPLLRQVELQPSATIAWPSLPASPFSVWRRPGAADARTTESARSALQRLAAANPQHAPPGSGTAIERQFDAALDLLRADDSVAALRVTQYGYDTHSAQRNRHAGLLADLATALQRFRSGLLSAGLWRQVLIVTSTPSGRSVHENAAGGTDHGSASSCLVLGGSVHGGVYGQRPAMAQIAAGTAHAGMPEEELHATLAQGWWGLTQPRHRRGRTGNRNWLRGLL